MSAPGPAEVARGVREPADGSEVPAGLERRSWGIGGDVGSGTMTTRGKVRRQSFITRADLQANPDTLYVFGDNMARTGFGGQAHAMRGEPNAVGVLTKWQPSTKRQAYFDDTALASRSVVDRIRQAFTRCLDHIEQGGDVIIPTDGIGTGFAELPTRAPKLYAWIEGWIAMLERH